MKLFKKSMAIALSITLAASIFAGVPQCTAQAADHSGLKKYSSDKYGITPFYKGKAFVTYVSKNGNFKEYIIDTKGKKIKNFPKYDYNKYIIEMDNHVGLQCPAIRLIKKDKCAILGKNMKPMTPFKYDYVYEEKSGFYPVKINSKYGFVNSKGKEVVPCKYHEYNSPSEGMIPVEKNKKWGYYNYDGKLVIPLQYDEAESFSNGLAVVRKGDKYGYIDKEGNVVIPIEYDSASNFSEDLAGVTKDGQGYYINRNNDIIIETTVYGEPRSFHDGIAQISDRDSDLCYYIDKNNNLINDKAYGYWSRDFHNGYAIVEGTKNGRMGIIDTKGKEIVAPTKYYSINNFDSDVFIAELFNHKCGLLDKNGKAITPFKVTGIPSFDSGVAIYDITTFSKFKTGYMDNKGNIY